MLTTLNNWTLSRKLLIAFVAIGALMGALAITGVLANRELSATADRHVSRGLASVTALSNVLGQIREERIIVYSQMTATKPEEIAKLEDRFASTSKKLSAAVDTYVKVGGDDLQADINKLRALTASLIAVNTQIMASKHLAPNTTFALIKGEGKDASHDTIAQADLLQEKTLERSDKSVAAAHAFNAGILALTITLSVVALAGLAAIWYLLAKTVSNPMAELATVTTKLAAGDNVAVPHLGRADELGAIAEAVEQFRSAAERRAASGAEVTKEQQAVTSALGDALTALTAGDLTNAITADFPTGYAILKTDFNSALSSLRGLISGVTDSANGIRTGSHEIAQASEDLARRTEGNAASLEETSAALVQIDTRLKATALSSSQTVLRADQAIATVGGGRATADEAVQAMGRVSDSAKGIDSVIEGLDKIAFQTRVLAMNAAVEAGRAGDAGRGFAVVADLVSALAMRAEEEAKRARDQLTLTQTDIVTAVQAVQKVDGALANISSDVAEVHKLLGTMANDATAQSSAITQITAAISAMDQSTQQNAAMVEETSAAARNLTTEVTSLAEQAAMFKTEDTAPMRRAAPKSIAPPRASALNAVKKTGLTRAPSAAVPAMASADGDTWSAF